MKPFQTPDWRKKQIKRKYRQKAKVINEAVSGIEKVLKNATEKIIDTALISGAFFQPSLNEINVISDDFYYTVIKEAYLSVQEEKKAQKGKRRLAKGPGEIPEDLFKDKKFFQRIMKRSRAMSEKLKKAYLQKLRRKFRRIMPLIQNGEMTPKEAKEQLMHEWKSSKGRVETIFRTETTNYFSKVQVSFFQDDPEIIGFLFDSIVDVAETDICRSRHGLIFRPDHTGTKSIAYNTPALHYNCRSHLIALANTPENRKLLEDKSRDPDFKKIEPLPDGWR